MGSPQSTRPRGYRFGPFAFDAATLELRRQGEHLALPRQPASLLHLLLRNAGRLVTREEIQRSCWPETGFGVDPSINAAVRQIRRALGDDAANSRYLETLPRRGYRFQAEVCAIRSPRRVAGLDGWGRWPVARAAGVALVALALLLGPVRSPTSASPESLPEPLRLAYSKAALLLESQKLAQAVQSLPLFRQVADAEPRFAPAWAGLAEAQLLTRDHAGARQGALEALYRDPDLASAHHVLGLVKLVEDWDLEGAEESLRRAVALESENLQHRIGLAFALISAGKTEPAGRLLDHVYLQDPIRFALKADAGWMEYLLGRYQRSLDLCSAAAELEPENVWAEDCATADLVRMGRFDEAVDRIETALHRWGIPPEELPWPTGRAAQSSTVSGRAKVRIYWAWRAQRLEERGTEGAHYRLATLYGDLGRPEDALRALEAAAAEKSWAVVVAGAEPAFQALRGESRFQALLERG